MATASGMGAITATLYCSVVAGDEIVADETLYGCTFAFLSKEITQLGVKVSFINMNDIDALKAALTDKTKVVYFETPCNPTMKTRSALPISSAPSISARMLLFTARPNTSTVTATLSRALSSASLNSSIRSAASASYI